jgi:hypothetical protein
MPTAGKVTISKKLLKTKIKERDLKAKAAKLTKDLEEDERSEYQMLSEKLGEFADTRRSVRRRWQGLDISGTQARMGAS